MTGEAIKSELLQLPDWEQLEIVQMVLERFTRKEKQRLAEDEWSEEQKIRLFKLVEDAETGLAKMIPLEKYKTKIKEKYGISA